MDFYFAGMQISTPLRLDSFHGFEGIRPSSHCIEILPGIPSQTGSLLCQHEEVLLYTLPGGWRFDSPNPKVPATITASADYARLTYHLPPCENEAAQREKLLLLLRIALECGFVLHDTISLHAACIEWKGRAVAFTAPSGTGKSTRAGAWADTLGARLISDDRPAIRLDGAGALACGVPWDGKGCVYRQTEAPLHAICQVQRAPFVRLRRLSTAQARRLLMGQCFLPLWDPVAATAAMGVIRRLIDRVPVYRLLGGPDAGAALAARDLLFGNENPTIIQEAANDMKIKGGFVLREIVGEQIVMPTGENINKFGGALVLNEVSAFIWQKLQQPVAREDLLDMILSEFEVDRDTASRDLDELLDKLARYDLLEEEPA